MRDFRNPRYKVLRDREECIDCDLCVRQCANEVHYRDEKTGALRADSMKCVNCQRCTLLCPTRDVYKRQPVPPSMNEQSSSSPSTRAEVSSGTASMPATSLA